jgi:hypothetical protein
MSSHFAHRLAAATILVAVTGALMQPMLEEHAALLDGVKAVTGGVWLMQAPR